MPLPSSLPKTQFVADRDNLEIDTVEGDMADFSALSLGGTDESRFYYDGVL